MREVTINDEAVLIVASPITPWIYEDEFHEDMMAELLSLVGKNRDESKRHYGAVPKMAWAMARCAKYPAAFPDFLTWIEAIGGWDFSDEQLNQGVILEAVRGLFRGKAALVSAYEAKLKAAADGEPTAPGCAGLSAADGSVADRAQHDD